MNETDYKSRIWKSAEEIIKNQGFKHLTIANIVKKSKISNRNFYECYPSKEDLLEELRNSLQCSGIEIPDERKSILELAEAGISQYGFNNITLEKIAKSAGLNRGTIYKHFSDKYELLECCIEYQFSRLKSLMNMIYKDNEDKPEDFIRKYMEGYCYFLNNSFESSIFTEAWSHMNYRKNIRALTYDLQDHLRGLFQRCLETGISQGIFKKELNLNTVSDLMLIIYGGMAFLLGKAQNKSRISDEDMELLLNVIYSTLRIVKE